MIQSEKVWVAPYQNGVLLRLYVQPSSRKNQVIGPHGEEGRLKIKITAPPTDHQANEALLALLKTLLKVKTSDLTILRGHTSRMKDVYCSLISVTDATHRLFAAKTITK